jgi:hypothetical protein
VCEVIKAWTRIRLGKATGRGKSEKHYRKRTGSHHGLDKGVKLHITPMLETSRPRKAAAGSLTTGVNQEGIPKRTLHKTFIQRPLPGLHAGGLWRPQTPHLRVP